MNIGSKIKYLVEKSNEFNSRDFAKAIGHTEASLYGIYKKEDISTKLLKEILTLLNVSLSEFFSEKVEKQSKPLKAKVVFDLSPEDVLTIDFKNKKLEITKAK